MPSTLTLYLLYGGGGIPPILFKIFFE